MTVNDLTMREIFNQFVESQKKSIEVQKETAKVIDKMSDTILELKLSIESRKDYIPNYIKWITLGGWFLAAVALGIKGMSLVITFFTGLF